MFGVRPDRFDHEIESAGAVDFARNAVSHVGLDEAGFGKVIEPINTLRVEVLQQEHRIRRVLRPGEQEQMIGAEVEQWGEPGGRRTFRPPPIGSAVEGLTRRTPPRGVSHSAAPDQGRRSYSSGEVECLPALRRLSPPSRKISEFSTSRSAMAVAMVVL